jgi:hypothetical protein
MMRVVPFEPEHLARLEGREVERRLFTLIADRDAYARAMVRPGLSFTGLGDDGAVIGCAGVMPLWSGVGQAWALLSVRAPGAFKAVHRAVCLGLDNAFSSGGFHRVQISVAADFPGARRWAEHLGFVCEGLMRGYGPLNDDHFLFAKVIK